VTEAEAEMRSFSVLPPVEALRADPDPRSDLMETLDGLCLPATPENLLAILFVVARGEIDPAPAASA
jgi:hypothetical protein